MNAHKQTNHKNKCFLFHLVSLHFTVPVIIVQKEIEKKKQSMFYQPLFPAFSNLPDSEIKIEKALTGNIFMKRNTRTRFGFQRSGDFLFDLPGS